MQGNQAQETLGEMSTQEAAALSFESRHSRSEPFVPLDNDQDLTKTDMSLPRWEIVSADRGGKDGDKHQAVPGLRTALRLVHAVSEQAWKYRHGRLVSHAHSAG